MVNIYNTSKTSMTEQEFGVTFKPSQPSFREHFVLGGGADILKTAQKLVDSS